MAFINFIETNERSRCLAALPSLKSAHEEFHTHLNACGGRMTKVAGRAASYAPSLGQVFSGLSASSSAIALGALLLHGSANASFAGSCTEITPGIWSCSGPASGSDVTLFFSAPTAGALHVSTENGFGLSTSTGNGIELYNSAGDTSMSFVDNYASPISGALNGIAADNAGSGSLSITTTGQAIGATVGIYARNFGFGTSLTISTAGVTGGYAGIVGYSAGTGAVSVTSTEQVTGNSYFGIRAFNTASGTDLAISATEVTGGENGILANNYGTGELSITTTGQVTGNANNRGNGTGSITFTSAGMSLFGTDYNGITAGNSDNGTDLTISAAAVTGDVHGIEADNRGTGALSITTTGQVTGTNYLGIYAYNSNGSTDLTISAAAVAGGTDGIFARNRGTGALSITTTGQVTGTNYDGIDADNGSSGTDLTILAAAVAAGDNGIEADNDGTGALTITTTGQVTGDDVGIRARNSSAGTNLTISTAAVTGGSDGISARNRGTGITTITAAGAIRGGTGAGIRTEGVAGATVRVTLDAGSSVAATSGSAIVDTVANASVQVNTGASVTGAISLGDGSDTLTFAGGDFSGVTLFDGGDDALAGDGFIDTLSFAGSSGTLNSDLVRNFERMTISGGSNVTLSNNILMFNDGAAGNDLIINQGGTLTLASGATRLSGLSNAGRLSLSNGAVGDRAVIEGNLQSSGGTVALDAVLGGDGSAADTLNVTGDASGTTMIAIQNFGGTGAQTKDGIEVVQVAGAIGGTFQLDSTAINPSGEKVITVGGFDYMLKQQSGGAFALQSEVSRMAVSGAPAFEALGGHLLSLAALDTAFGRIATRQSGSAPTAVTRNSFSFTAALEDSVDKREIWFDFTGAQTTSSRVNSTAGIKETKADTKKLAFGRDFAIAQTGAGTFYGGVNAFFGHSDAQVVSSSGFNQIATSFKGIGASATFASGNGLYVDGQLQYTQTTSDITHSGAGQLAGDITGHTWSAALEVARSFELQSDFILTPSVQLGYQKLNLPGVTGPSNNAISFDENESKWAHVGARLEKTFATVGYSGSVFGTLGLTQMYDTKSSTTIAGTTFSGELGDKNVVLGLGGSIRWSARASAHASISYASGVGSFASDNSMKATIGVQMEF